MPNLSHSPEINAIRLPDEHFKSSRNQYQATFPDWLFNLPFSSLRTQAQRLSAKFEKIIVKSEGRDLAPFLSKYAPEVISEVGINQIINCEESVRTEYCYQILCVKYFQKNRLASKSQSWAFDCNREMRKQKLRLTAAEKLINPQDDRIDFNIHDLFTLHALGAERAITSSPLIAPDLWNSSLIETPDQKNRNSPAIFLNKGSDKDIEGYSFRYGFYETLLDTVDYFSADRKAAFKKFSPILCLDVKIYEILLKSIERDNNSTKTALSLLKGIRDFASLASHDYIHHLIYGLHFPILERVCFTNRGSYFERFFTGMPPFRSLAGIGLKGSTINSLETFSYLANREIWNKIFHERPHLPGALNKKLLGLIKHLSNFKQELEQQDLAESAGSICSYLLTITLTQLSLIMPLSQIEELAEKKTTKGSTNEALEKLNLSPYAFSSQKLMQRLCIGSFACKFERETEAERMSLLSDFIANEDLASITPALKQSYSILQDLINSYGCLSKVKLSGIRAFTRGRVPFESFRAPWIDCFKYQNSTFSGEKLDVAYIIKDFLSYMKDSYVHRSEKYIAMLENYHKQLEN